MMLLSILNDSSVEDRINTMYAYVPNYTDVIEEVVQNTSQSDVDVVKLWHSVETLKTNGDVFFLVVISALILFMQCGFAFLEAGAVRSKNCTNILIKNMLDACIAGVAYWAIGYPFAFGEGNAFIGYQHWFSYGLSREKMAYWLFQMVFAATAATIVSGAMAERCNFIAYFVYSFGLTGFVYPVVSHWAWSKQGWLKKGLYDGQVIFQDYAGSGVVHLLGGVCAIIGAFFLGPRHGRFDVDGRVQDIKGHSVPLAALGGFILMFGFLACNGGKQGGISEEGDGGYIAMAMVNTIIAGSFAAFSGLLFNRFGFLGTLKWSLVTTLNCSLTGMVAVCAGCNVYYPWASSVIGTVAGLNFILVAHVVSKVLYIDDPLDATAVHGGGGLWGILAAPIFTRETGLLYTGSRIAFVQFGWNLVGALAIVVWSCVMATLMFWGLKMANLLRVNALVEERGLDIPKHGEQAYPVDAYGHGWGEKGDTLKNLVLKTVQGGGGALFGGGDLARQMLQATSSSMEHLPKRFETPELQQRSKRLKPLSGVQSLNTSLECIATINDRHHDRAHNGGKITTTATSEM